MNGLWPHQKTALAEVFRHIREGRRRVCVAAPTGSGKTYLSVEIARRNAAQGGRTFFTAPKIVLVNQTADAFADRLGLPRSDIGVLQADATRGLDRPFVVGTPQSVRTRGLPANCRLVVVDECHKRFGDMHARVRSLPNPPTVIGLTATPYARGMRDDYDALVRCATTDALVDSGVLTRARLFAGEPMDTSGLRVNRMTGDVGTEAEIAERTEGILDDMVGRWSAMCEEHFGGPARTLAFTRSIEQGRMVVEAFREAGHDFRHVHSGDDPKARARDVEAFRQGACTGLVSVDVLAEGFDVPDSRVALFLRPTRSLTRLAQSIGRVMRSAPGKDSALAIDMTTSLHGMAGELLAHWRDGPSALLGEKPESDAAAPLKHCPTKDGGCGALVPIGARFCPECGFEFPKAELAVVGGELVEITRKGALAMSDADLDAALRKWTRGERGRAWALACAVGGDKAPRLWNTPDVEQKAYTIACAVWSWQYGPADIAPKAWHVKRLVKTDAVPPAMLTLALEKDAREYRKRRAA